MKAIDPKNPPRWFATSIGRFYRAAETKKFVYYVNYQESDDNGNTYMFNKKTGELASDNFFANDDLYKVVLAGQSTWLSPTMRDVALKVSKQNYKTPHDIPYDEVEKWSAKNELAFETHHDFQVNRWAMFKEITGKKPAEKPIKIIVTMEGGLVTSVFANDPDKVRLVVVDYDVEGNAEEEGCAVTDWDNLEDLSGHLSQKSESDLDELNDAERTCRLKLKALNF